MGPNISRSGISIFYVHDTKFKIVCVLMIWFLRHEHEKSYNLNFIHRIFKYWKYEKGNKKHKQKMMKRNILQDKCSEMETITFLYFPKFCLILFYFNIKTTI
jgi:hypothetical protein